jgi:hypothetical protein
VCVCFVVRRAMQNGTFQWSAQTEPHASRKPFILAAHPEIKELMGE